MATPRRRRSRDRRFTWILWLLPGSFREDHEQELLRVWREESRASPRETDGGRIWRAALIDTLRVAPTEHRLALTRSFGAAFTRLHRSPGFAAAAVLTLALGTGATAAVFSLLNGVVFSPMPWQSPETVGLLWAIQPRGERTWLSFPELEQLPRESPALSAVAGMTDLRPHYAAQGIGHEVQALAVSHNFFMLLGVPMALGRDFMPEDDRQGAAPVVILSDQFWRSRLGADPTAVGQAITVDGTSYRIAGVLPRSFSLLPASSVLPETVDIWLPLVPHLASRDRNVRFLHAVARLRAHRTFAEANADLDAYGRRVTNEYPTVYLNGRWTFGIVSFAEDTLRHARTALGVLFALVSLVLVMACANVANLMLARGETRRNELAVRTALGAGPARLGGELLAEAILLAFAGTVLGAGLTVAVPLVLRAFEPSALPRLGNVGVDVRVVAFIGALMLVAIFLFASVPLLERLRLRNPASVLIGRNGGRTVRSARVSKSLVLIQTALATSMLVVAVCLADTFVRLNRVNLGFAPGHVLTGRVSLSRRHPPGPPAAQFVDELEKRARTLPGVRGAAAITQLPLSGSLLGSSFLVAPGPDAPMIDADLRGITPTYFEVMRMPLLRGRAFTDADAAETPGVAIVDEAFARRIAEDGQVVGSRIRWFRQPNAELEIVGVVTSVRHRGPDQPIRETVYRPHRQYPRNSVFMALALEPSVAPNASLLREAVSAADPSQPVADVMMLQDRIGRSLARPRTSVALTAVLALLGLALASVGLYGVVSVGVAQRMREFGVRLALGASPAAIERMVVREGLGLAVAGAMLGSIAGALLLRAMRSVLEVTGDTADPATFAIAAGVIVAVSAAAVWIPMRRASNADAMAVLRAD